MRTIKADIFTCPSGPLDAVCITTNGMIKQNGHAVMGRGIALEADRRFSLGLDLARLLKSYGNHVFDMGVRLDSKTRRQMRVFTFPTKQDWRDKSSLTLIQQSAHELVRLVNATGVRTCYLVKPGCSNGGLNWSQVEPVLEPILDDRFVIADFN